MRGAIAKLGPPIRGFTYTSLIHRRVWQTSFLRIYFGSQPHEITSPPRRKTGDFASGRSAPEMVFARRSTRLRFMRQSDHGPSDRYHARLSRWLFFALPDRRLPLGSERLVLSWQRGCRFQSARLPPG